MLAPDITWLVDIVDRIVHESGDPTGFDAKAWVERWISEPCRPLGNRRPSEYLDTEDGRRIVRGLVGAMQSGAYV